MTTVEAPRDHSREMWCHLAAFAGLIFFIPFANVFGPLLVWQTAPVKSPELDFTGKESVNFQITMSLAAIAIYAICFVVTIVVALVTPQTKTGGYIMLAFSGFEILAYLALAGVWLTCVITAGMRASAGVGYRYPLSLRMVR